MRIKKKGYSKINLQAISQKLFDELGRDAIRNLEKDELTLLKLLKVLCRLG